MYNRTVLRKMKCVVCNEDMHKGDPCVTFGSEDEPGRSMCIQCLTAAWALTLQTYNTHFNIKTIGATSSSTNEKCSICHKRLGEDEIDNLYFHAYYTHAFLGRHGKVIQTSIYPDCACMNCIENIVRSCATKEAVEEAELHRFMYKVKQGA